jgi:hypothetical protein
MALLRPLFLGTLFIISTGCSSSLVVSAASPKPGESFAPLKGVRVHQRVPYVITKEIKMQRCTRTEDSIVHLAVGEPYDINFNGAAFAKSEFTVILTDDGGLKQVTLNSTPQLAETLKSLGELTEKVSGIIRPAFAPECGNLVSETIVSARRLEIKAP